MNGFSLSKWTFTIYISLVLMRDSATFDDEINFVGRAIKRARERG